MQYMVPGGLSPLDRRLLHHWLTGLAGVVSMADGPSGNPYLTHLTPLLVASPALRSATLSMSAWHLSLLGGGGNKVGEHLGGNRDAAAMDVAGRHHRLEAISSLRQSMLQPGAAAAEISLATILMLQLADRLFAGADDSPANHLAGASAVVRTRPVGRWAATPTGSFLLGVYLYQDVLASVTRGTRPLFDLDQDSVMVEGLGSLARLTAVVRVVGHISSMHCMDFDTSRVYAAHLKTMLDSLEPQPPIDDGTEDGAALTAEAYRQAAYIYLGRVAYNVESPDRVGVCLALLGRVPATSSVVSAHVWPIWTAGCEAVDARNRQLVRDRLDEMHRLRRLPSLHRLRCDVEDIWRVKDAQRASTGKDGVDCIKAIWKRRQRTADLI